MPVEIYHTHHVRTYTLRRPFKEKPADGTHTYVHYQINAVIQLGKQLFFKKSNKVLVYVMQDENADVMDHIVIMRKKNKPKKMSENRIIKTNSCITPLKKAYQKIFHR